MAKALSPAKVKEVRIDEYEGRAEVIVPDYQLSLAIGKEGQNARLAARLTGWRVDIKSETQLAEEEAYQTDEWAQGEWVIDPATGELVWVPAVGGDAILGRRPVAAAGRPCSKSTATGLTQSGETEPGPLTSTRRTAAESTRRRPMEAAGEAEAECSTAPTRPRLRRPTRRPRRRVPTVEAERRGSAAHLHRLPACRSAGLVGARHARTRRRSLRRRSVHCPAVRGALVQGPRCALLR